jgi:hypothetical protein
MMMQRQMVGVGVSGGVLAAADEWLAGGFYWGVQASLWMSDFLAIEVDLGGTSLQDDGYGGDLTINPMTVSAVLSLPVPTMYGPDIFRWRVGVGAGVAALDHTYASIDPMGVVNLQAGSEWMVQGGRLFGVMDLMIGDEVFDDTDTLWWDLRTMVTFRAGIELGF